MSTLVGYGSSDEEEDDVETERPAKVGRCYTNATEKCGCLLTSTSAR